MLSRGPGDLDLPLPPATSAARSGVGADGAGPALLDPTRLAGLAGAGIPPVVLGAYQGAVAQLAVTNPGCLLRWTVLAGIGKVESNHGRDGAGITAAGTILPAILGPVLDGTGGNAAIPDTDRGRLDGDPVWDRAVGPMQFIPGTWMGVAPKGDPNNIVDATVAAGRYLCSGGRDLADPRQLAAAIHAYNPSDAYVAVVLAWISAYDAAGPAAVPTAPLPVLPTVAPPAAGWWLALPRASVPAAAAVAAPAPTWRPEVTDPLPTTPARTEPPPTTASPTPTASSTPSPSPSPSPTPTPSPSPSPSPTPTATPCSTPPPTATPTPSPTATPSPTPTPTPTPTGPALVTPGFYDCTSGGSMFARVNFSGRTYTTDSMAVGTYNLDPASGAISFTGGDLGDYTGTYNPGGPSLDLTAADGTAVHCAQ